MPTQDFRPFFTFSIAQNDKVKTDLEFFADLLKRKNQITSRLFQQSGLDARIEGSL